MGTHTGSIVDDTIANFSVEDVVGRDIPNRVARISVVRELYGSWDAGTIQRLASPATVIGV